MKPKLIACLNLLLYLIASSYSFTQVGTFGPYQLHSVGKTKDLVSKAAIGKFFFHKHIGGISFEQIAQPDDYLAHSNISLQYNNTADDKNQLKITIGNDGDSVYYVSIPDWQLVPIANYANDTNNAIFTLTWNDENAIDDRNWNDDKDPDSIESPIRYHKAFRDELLGLRMFQADLLFAQRGGAFLAGLPKDPLGNLLLADSEKGFRLDTVNADLTFRDLSFSCPTYSSYILTDWGREARFGVSGKQFYITGEPYYLFTDVKTDYSKWLYELRDYVVNKKRESLENAPFLIDTAFKSLDNLLREGIFSWTYRTAELLVDELEEEYGDTFDYPAYKHFFDSDTQKIDLLLSGSQEMEELNDQIYQFNPVVFNSCIVTMRYAAFFRYVKQSNPKGWNSFMKQIGQAKGKYTPANKTTLARGIITPNKIN